MTVLGLITRYQIDLSTDENGVTPMPAPIRTATCWCTKHTGTKRERSGLCHVAGGGDARSAHLKVEDVFRCGTKRPVNVDDRQRCRRLRLLLPKAAAKARRERG